MNSQGPRRRGRRGQHAGRVRFPDLPVNSNSPCEDRQLPRERGRVQTEGGSARSAGDAKNKCGFAAWISIEQAVFGTLQRAVGDCSIHLHCEIARLFA